MASRLCAINTHCAKSLENSEAMGQAGHEGRKAFILFLEKYFSDAESTRLLVCGKVGKLRNVECREFEVD